MSKKNTDGKADGAECATEYDMIMVLGARVRADYTPSDALRQRLGMALSCYEVRPVPIICCGAKGSDEPTAEGDFMRAWLIKRGVPAEDVHSEIASYDTMQNISNAMQIAQTLGLSHALVVTSDYHIPRALAICKRAGLKASGQPSPSLRRLWLKNNIREALAWVKFYLFPY